MVFYQIAITHTSSATATVKYLRSISAIAISEIQKRLGTSEPLLTFDSLDGPVVLDLVDCSGKNNQRILNTIDSLIALGNTVEIKYSPARDSEFELVTLEVAQNLMRSEIGILREECG